MFMFIYSCTFVQFSEDLHRVQQQQQKKKISQFEFVSALTADVSSSFG